MSGIFKILHFASWAIQTLCLMKTHANNNGLAWLCDNNLSDSSCAKHWKSILYTKILNMNKIGG